MYRNVPRNLVSRIALVLALLLIPQPAGASADSARWHTFTALNGLAGNIVQAIWEDSQGRIWFGTEKGASLYDGATWQTYRSADGLIDDNVWSISGDTESVWFATSSGLGQFSNNHWFHYSTADGLPNNDVRAVLVAHNGTVWVGTFGGGIAFRKPNETRWHKYDLSSVIENREVTVQMIWQAPDDTIWFGTGAFGALRLLPDGTLKRKTFLKGSRNTVWAIGGWRSDGQVWIGTFRGPVLVAPDDSETVATVVVDEIWLADTEILVVADDGPNSVWFGTRANGVLHRGNKGWTHYTTADGLSRDYVLAIQSDHSGRVWFGTRGGGVTVRDPSPARRYQKVQAQVAARDIQSNSPIALNSSDLSFNQNNLQFTFTAPVQWMPAQDISFRYWLVNDSGTQAAHIVHGNASSNGAASSQINDFINLLPGKYQLHVVPIIDDVMGVESVYSFAIRSAPPALTIDTLNVSVGSNVLPRGVTLDATLFGTMRQVQLGFAATDDATSADRLRYEYRVDGPNGDWSQANGASTSLLLAQGEHHIDVRAIDSDGNMSQTATLTVIVPQPFWITVLVYLLIVAVPGALGGAAGAFWYRRWARRQALLRAVRGHLIPYDVGPLIVDPDRYIGRGPILDTILGRIDNNSFYVYGEPRIGKTSLLAQLRQRLGQRNTIAGQHEYLPVFRNIQDVPQEQFWLAIIRSENDASANLGLALPVPQEHSSYDDFDAQDDLEMLVAAMAIRAAPRRPLVVLLLDEVDTLQRYDPFIRQRFRAFCQHMQESLRVVLVGVQPPRDEAGETSPWYNIFAPLMLEPLALKDARFLIRSYNQNPYSYTPEAEQALIEASDRKPFYTQWLCAEAVRSALAHDRMRILPEDVAHAIITVISERRRQYRAFWENLPAEVQADLRTAQQNSGALPPERAARGDYDTLLNAGLVIKTLSGYCLASLFRRWLDEISSDMAENYA